MMKKQIWPKLCLDDAMKRDSDEELTFPIIASPYFIGFWCSKCRIEWNASLHTCLMIIAMDGQFKCPNCKSIRCLESHEYDGFSRDVKKILKNQLIIF